MSIVAAFAVPHPPLAIAGVGRGRETEIGATLASYHKAAQKVREYDPQVLIVSSPHATCYADYIHISPGTHASGDFAQFDDPADEIEADYDSELVEKICAEAITLGIPAGTFGERNRSLDHGTMVPLSFIQAAGVACPIVRIGISGLTPLDHYNLGVAIQRAVEALDRRAVYIASGDLSHKMADTSPYGFAPDGPVFDDFICKAFEKADFLSLLTCDSGLAERAAECGLRSFQMMAGAFDGYAVSSELYSHEGPFGVGYAVAEFVPLGPSDTRHLAEQYHNERVKQMQEIRAKEDPLVQLARMTVESWTRTHKEPSIDDEGVAGGTLKLPDWLLSTRAGAFSSIKKYGSLRGCIGTTVPVQENLAHEIIANAISAACHDPRFDPITPDELDDLVYSVDVLGELEDIDSPSQLDTQRYGVVVSTRDGRRGLLLPALDGVDTVEEQISIARKKGGIRPHEHIKLQRFEVVRHV
ncbi:MAG: AmmeMemoRadiSam system protein A [Coriobacteriales bacterium]|nr:AmmeMemoRadiSam system protein A [Coriobacteriales bacterium]